MSAVNKFITKEIWLFILRILMKGHSSADHSASVASQELIFFSSFLPINAIKRKGVKVFFFPWIYLILLVEVPSKSLIET